MRDKVQDKLIEQHRIGLALLPDKDTLQQIIRSQQNALKFCPLSPTLGLETNLPHITILQGRFTQEANLPELTTSLQSQLQLDKKQLEFEISALNHIRSGWYFIWLKNDSLLHKIQQTACQYLLKHMFVLPEDVTDKDFDRLDTLQAENQRQYGYCYIGQSYRPHITFGRTISKQALTDETEIQRAFNPLKGLQGYFEKLTIYAAGENGSHAQTLFEAKIQ